MAIYDLRSVDMADVSGRLNHTSAFCLLFTRPMIIFLQASIDNE